MATSLREFGSTPRSISLRDMLSIHLLHSSNSFSTCSFFLITYSLSTRSCCLLTISLWSFSSWAFNSSFSLRNSSFSLSRCELLANVEDDLVVAVETDTSDLTFSESTSAKSSRLKLLSRPTRLLDTGAFGLERMDFFLLCWENIPESEFLLFCVLTVEVEMGVVIWLRGVLEVVVLLDWDNNEDGIEPEPKVEGLNEEPPLSLLLAEPPLSLLLVEPPLSLLLKSCEWPPDAMDEVVDDFPNKPEVLRLDADDCGPA